MHTFNQLIIACVDTYHIHILYYKVAGLGDVERDVEARLQHEGGVDKVPVC